MTELEAYVSLNSAGVGYRKLKALLEHFGKPENILGASCARLGQIEGIGPKLAQQICALKDEDLKKECDLIKKYGLLVLTPADAGYPENLKNIYDPPIVIYVKGKLQDDDKRSIAIVGSRRASFYGLSCAERFAHDLCACGLTVVSGMARGIDTAAHKGALGAQGRTIAVLGSGFAQIYPPENKKLLEQIVERGAVISEFPVETGPLRQNFPRRNRLISGLSLGVLVVEAARNSGALITSDFALEQGREVFALPGRVDSDTAFGANHLIQQGAKLVCSVQDILEELEIPLISSLVLKEGPDDSQAEEKKNLSNDETIVYNLLSCKPLSLDEIITRSGLGLQRLMELLLGLELKRIIKRLPGRQFIRS